jgi:hypothetical protein
MAFDPREWTDKGYTKRYHNPRIAIKRMREDCLTGVEYKTKKPLTEIDPALRTFVCSYYMLWIYHLIKKCITYASKDIGLVIGLIDILYNGCPEIAKKVDRVAHELYEKRDELKRMDEFEREEYLNRIVVELFEEFMKLMRDWLGDYYYEVQDYFIERCELVGVEPLPRKLPPPAERVIVKEKKRRKDRGRGKIEKIKRADGRTGKAEEEERDT